MSRHSPRIPTTVEKELAKSTSQQLEELGIRLANEDESQIDTDIEAFRIPRGESGMWVPSLIPNEWKQVMLDPSGTQLTATSNILLVNPSLKFIDLITRFKSEYLPRGELHYLDSCCIFKLNSFTNPRTLVSLLDIGNDHKNFDGDAKLAEGDDVISPIAKAILSLMIDLYFQGVYIYPRVEDIYVRFIFMGYEHEYPEDYDEENEEEEERELDSAIPESILFYPNDLNISYEYVPINYYIRSNIGIFTEIVRMVYEKDEGRPLDPSTIQHTFLDKIRNKDWSNPDIPYGPMVLLPDNIPKYLNLAPDTSNGILASIIYSFSSSHLPLSALFMAIDLYYRVGNYKEVSNVIKYMYEKKGVGNYSLIKSVLVASQGILFVNPVYNKAYDLTQLATFYKWVIEGRPDLYHQVDINKYTSILPKTGDSKFITCYEFFNPTEYYNPNTDQYSTKYISHS